LLAHHWRWAQPGLAGDIDQDGDVDLYDLAEFVRYWLGDCSGTAPTNQ
jgi:hypothetical protein